MAQVSAFVAHSFREQDEDHVNKFLGLFSHISEINPNFGWDHALGAKSQDLREKVLGKIEGKNLLVAICSRHSYLIDPGDLQKPFFGSTQKIAGENLNWVASSWVVQEIGLALGRRMNLILLIEEGVSKPGGLQGDIEYIQFSRDAPERSFMRVLEMVTALISSSSTLESNGVASANVIENESKNNVEKEKVKNEEVVLPSATMSLDELSHGWFLAALKNQSESQELYRNAFLASPHGASALERARWDAREEWIRQLVNSNGNINAVRDKRKLWPNDSKIAMYEGRILQQLEEYALAADSFVIAADNADGEQEITGYLNSAISVLVKANRHEQLEEILQRARSIVASVGDQKLTNNFLRVFQNVYETDKLTKVASLEVLLESEPTDLTARFDLAYLYSEIEMHEMAFYHYGRVPEGIRSVGVWNNLGVAAGHLKLNGISIDAYTKAGNEGNTLAISNKARLQRDAGLYDEAESACRTALGIVNCDSQVADTLTSIISLRDKEEKNSLEIKNVSQPVSEFMRGLGRACAEIELESFDGSFQFLDCVCTTSKDGKKIIIVGTYNQSQSYLRLGISPEPEVTMVLRFSGKRYGNAVIGTLNRTKKDNSLLTLLAQSAPEEKFCLYYDRTEDALRVLEMEPSILKSKTYVAPRYPAAAKE